MHVLLRVCLYGYARVLIVVSMCPCSVDLHLLDDAGLHDDMQSSSAPTDSAISVVQAAQRAQAAALVSASRNFFETIRPDRSPIYLLLQVSTL